jgi:phenylpropionate dioxygenase-like ring-hydroxylating dioxygenase large terminal subunit
MTVDDLDVPMLLTRHADGTFHAFVNACRHRGATLECRERGAAQRFACPFHGWTYDTGGALVGLPKADHFGDVDRSCLGLVELPAVERYGLLYVHPDRHGTIDVDALLGDELAAELACWDLGSLRHLDGDTYEVACSWKLAMDTFGETYHFPVLHKNTLSPQFHGNVQTYDTFGRNHRMVLARREIDGMRTMPEDTWDITIAGQPIYWLFPNVQLVPFVAGVFVVRAYPVGDDPGRHVSRIGFYLKPEVEDAGNAEALRAMVKVTFADVIRDEDYLMSAQQQRSASSGALDHLLFGRNEPALHHFHNTYRAALGMPLLPLLDDATATG